MKLEFSKNPFKIKYRINLLTEEINGKEKEISNRLSGRGVTNDTLKKLVERENKPLQNEVGILRSQLQFVWQFLIVLGNFLLAMVAITSLLITINVSNKTINNSLEANKINKQVADVQYENAQPFILITGGNEDATKVNIKNVGGGVAKDVFFLKHYRSLDTREDVFVLTKEKKVILGIAAGSEGFVNLNEKYMDRFKSEREILDKLSCITTAFLSEETNNWTAAFYKNLRGELFVTRFLGSSPKYDNATEYRKLSC